MFGRLLFFFLTNNHRNVMLLKNVKKGKTKGRAKKKFLNFFLNQHINRQFVREKSILQC